MENGGAILGADVISLAVERRRIVQIPEPGEDALVGDFFRVEDDLDDLGMSRIAAADLLVGRILHLATHEPGGGGIHAIELPVGRLDAPVAPGSERGDFRPGGHFGFRRGFGGCVHGGLRFAGRQHRHQRGDGKQEASHGGGSMDRTFCSRKSSFTTRCRRQPRGSTPAR